MLRLLGHDAMFACSSHVVCVDRVRAHYFIIMLNKLYTSVQHIRRACMCVDVYIYICAHMCCVYIFFMYDVHALLYVNVRVHIIIMLCT